MVGVRISLELFRDVHLFAKFMENRSNNSLHVYFERMPRYDEIKIVKPLAFKEL